jgi:glycerophosphoryl diester phosphodiesterase
MKKKMLLFLILLMGVMLWGGIGSSHVLHAAVEETPRTIKENSTHVLGNVNEPIDLTSINVAGTFGEIKLNQATLTSANPAVTITANSVTVSQKGTFPVNFTYQSTNWTLYFFIKLASETEYVIYEENFDYPSGTLPSSLQRFNNLGAAGGSAAIDNGRLLLSAYTIVLFPSYLQGFTNYIIEADMRMTTAANASRWTSVMYRYSTENYFQMAIRQDATAANGVEFAKRVSGGWNVAKTAAYSEALATNKTYRLKVDLKDTTVNQYIDNNLVMTYDSAFEYKYGRIGVQADNATVYYDNIKITLPVDYVEVERYQFKSVVNVFQPTTGIVAPATVPVWVNTAAQLDTFQNAVRPSTAIFRINSNLDVVDKNGVVLSTVYDALIAVDGKVIPAFYTNDVDTATAIGDLLKSYSILDVFVMSHNEDVIPAARSAHSVIRGVLFFEFEGKTELTNNDLLSIRRKTNSSQAVAAVLPAELVNREDVEYLQQRAMTVWVQANDDKVSHYQAILSGANGIITQTFVQLYSKYGSFPQNTHVRRPLMIAHRGLYAGAAGSSAPENTIEAALEAVQKGADILELDVHLTADYEVVIIHDATTQRTAPLFPSLSISTATLAQLKAINLIDPNGGRENLKIPTLGEYFEALKGSGAVIFIEIKPTSQLLVERVAALIEQYDMYEEAAIITFSAQNIMFMNSAYPDISNGLLTSSVLNANSTETSLSNTFSTVVPIKSTLNPNFGALTSQYINAIVHRGITVWPWTLNDFPVLNAYYNYGVGGITTDHIGYYQDTYNRLTVLNPVSSVSYEDAVGFKVRAQIETPNGTLYPYAPKLFIIDNGGTGAIFDDNGNLLSFEKAGTLVMMTQFTSYLPDGTKIELVSDLITLTILEMPAVEEPVTPAIAIWIATGGSLAALGGIAAFLFLKKKRIVV